MREKTKTTGGKSLKHLNILQLVPDVERRDNTGLYRLRNVWCQCTELQKSEIIDQILTKHALHVLHTFKRVTPFIIHATVWIEIMKKKILFRTGQILELDTIITTRTQK